MKRLMLVLAFATPVLAVACASDDEGGDCSGSVLSCSWAELSGKQEMEACDLITASLDEPAGTKYECKTGEHAGEFLTVENAQTCVSHSYPSNCPVTVQATLDCFKAARADACAAFGDNGACGKLLATAATCQ
jgi:hypothetical protein